MLLALVAFAGCGGGAKTTNLTPQPEPQVVGIPEWFVSPPTDASYLFA